LRVAVVPVDVGATQFVVEVGVLEVLTVPRVPAVAQNDALGQLTAFKVLVVLMCACCVQVPVVNAVRL